MIHNSNVLVTTKNKTNFKYLLFDWIEKQYKFNWDSYKEKPSKMGNMGDFVETPPPVLEKVGVRNYKLVPYKVMVRSKHGRAPYFSTRWKKVFLDNNKDGVGEADIRVIPIENYNGDLDVLMDAWKNYINSIEGDKYSLLLPIVALQEIIYKHFEGIILSQENRIIGIASLSVDENNEGRVSVVSASPYDIQNGNEEYIEDALRSGLNQYADSKKIALNMDSQEDTEIQKASTSESRAWARQRGLVAQSGDEMNPGRWVTPETRQGTQDSQKQQSQVSPVTEKTSNVSEEKPKRGRPRRNEPIQQKPVESSFVTSESGGDDNDSRPKVGGWKKYGTNPYPLYDTWKVRKDSAIQPKSWIGFKQISNNAGGGDSNSISAFFKANYGHLNPNTTSFKDWIPNSIKIMADSTDSDADVLAKGEIETDTGNKTVYIYTKDFALQQKKSKFTRITEFENDYEMVMDRIRDDSTAGRWEALAVWLADETGIRSGNGLGRNPYEVNEKGEKIKKKDKWENYTDEEIYDEYLDPVTGERKFAIGTVNLQSKHFKFEGTGKNRKLFMEFEGKNLTPWRKEIKNPELVELLKNRIDPKNPEKRIFGGDVSGPHAAYNGLYRYIRGNSQEQPGITNGRFSFHDWRTRRATGIAKGLVQRVPNRVINSLTRSDNPTRDFYDMIYGIGNVVASDLVDSTSVALKSYVDPLVFQPWIDKLAKKGVDIEIDFDTEQFKRIPQSQESEISSKPKKNKKSPRTAK